MRRVFVISLLCLSSLTIFASSIGGPGPVEFKKWRGSVWVRAAERNCTWRKNVDDKFAPLPMKWQPVKAGLYVGRFLVRTGSNAWIHVNGKLACVDRNSLVSFDSSTDIWAAVKRGQVSDVDGRRGKPILGAGESRIW